MLACRCYCKSMGMRFHRGVGFPRGVDPQLVAHPPDANRIRNLAEELSRSPSFLRIRRREIFRRYLELSMVKALETWRV